MIAAGLFAAFVISNLSWLMVHCQYRAAYRDSVKSEHLAIARARRAEQERDAAKGIATVAAAGWDRALTSNIRLHRRGLVERFTARRSELRH